MPGGPQIPNINRRRRNAPTIAAVDVPAAEPFNDAPAPLGFLAQPGRDLWSHIWGQPYACQYRAADLPALTRRCQLEDQWAATRSEKLLGPMQALDDRLGLTPRARAQLRWQEKPSVEAAIERFATEVIPERWQVTGTGE